MPRPSQYFELPKTSTEEMREWMAWQTEANERMKDQVVELENRINQGLRNRQAIIKNLKRQFEYLEKIQPTKSLPLTTNIKLRQEVVKIPLIQNKNDKGDVKFIKEDAIKPIPTMPNPNLINFNSPTVTPLLKDSTVHIPYMNAKTFADDVLLNQFGDEEFKSIDGVGNGRMTKKEIKKDDVGLLKEPNKEWKRNEIVVPYNKDVMMEEDAWSRFHWLSNPVPFKEQNRDTGSTVAYLAPIKGELSAFTHIGYLFMTFASFCFDKIGRMEVKHVEIVRVGWKKVRRKASWRSEDSSLDLNPTGSAEVLYLGSNMAYSINEYSVFSFQTRYGAFDTVYQSRSPVRRIQLMNTVYSSSELIRHDNGIKKYFLLRKCISLLTKEIRRSPGIDDEVVQDQRQRDDNDLQDERQDQPKEEEVEPKRCKRARTEKLLDPILFLLW
ncbi:hypothetical protein Tco_0264412 [Tanacetum coccineum]